jgi:hypothetical protein
MPLRIVVPLSISFLILGCSEQMPSKSNAAKSASDAPTNSRSADHKIPIDCALKNGQFGTVLKEVSPGSVKRWQRVIYSIPPSALKSNFSNQSGEYAITSQVIISTSKGKVLQSGQIAVKVENGIHTIHESVDPVNDFAPKVNGRRINELVIYFDTDEEYMDSKNNTIDTCFILK